MLFLTRLVHVTLIYVQGKLPLWKNSSKVAGTASRKTRCKWCFGERNLVYLLFIYINSVWGKELVVHGGCLYRDWVKTAWAKCLTKDSGQNACPGMMAPKQSVFGLMPVTVAARCEAAEVAVRQLRGRSCKEERPRPRGRDETKVASILSYIRKELAIRANEGLSSSRRNHHPILEPLSYQYKRNHQIFLKVGCLYRCSSIKNGGRPSFNRKKKTWRKVLSSHNLRPGFFLSNDSQNRDHCTTNPNNALWKANHSKRQYTLEY